MQAISGTAHYGEIIVPTQDVTIVYVLSARRGCERSDCDHGYALVGQYIIVLE